MRKPTCMLCGYRKLVLSEVSMIGYEGTTRINNITFGCPKCGAEISVKNHYDTDGQMKDFLKDVERR